MTRSGGKAKDGYNIFYHLPTKDFGVSLSCQSLSHRRVCKQTVVNLHFHMIFGMQANKTNLVAHIFVYFDKISKHYKVQYSKLKTKSTALLSCYKFSRNN